MTKLLSSIHNAEHRFDTAAERFFFHHPIFRYLAIFIGMPLFLLVAVFASTTILVLPLMLLCGYL